MDRPGQEQGRGSATDNSNTQLLAAKTAYQHRITSLVGYNSSADNDAIVIKSGTTTIFGPIPVPAGAGFTLTLDDPIVGNDGEAINFAAVTGRNTIYVSCTGHTRHTG